MELTVTVVDPTGMSPPADVEVTAAPRATLGAVLPALLGSVHRVEGGLSCGAQALDPSSVLGEPPLLDGAILTVGPPVRPQPRPLLELHVQAGPDCGGVYPLGPGEHGIGRVAEARVRVADPDVSRLHAVLRVGLDDAASTTVHDLGSTNGTTIDGTPVDRSGVVALPGQVVRIGDSCVALVVPEKVPVSCRPDGEGHLELNRPPRQVVVPTPTRVSLPTEPRPRERTRFPAIALAVPLLAGAVLALVTRSPTYLVFVLLSPLMVLGTYLSDRAGGRRARGAARSEHASALARGQETVRRTLAAESSARHSAHPDAATLLLSATGPRPRLWERRPEDNDYLEVRLGLGAFPAAVEVHTPGSAETTESTEHPQLIDVPVTVSFARAGVVGLAGARHEVIGLARAITAQLAGWHSPRHLGLVVLCGASDEDWSWVRWLPHVEPIRGEGPTTLVGRTPDQVRVRVAELIALLDSRVGDASFGGPWTGRSVVAVLDGAGALRRQPGVVRLLTEGPAIGIVVLCLENNLVSLPAECRATVEVSRMPAPRLRVRTEHATTYDGVVPDAVDERWANNFARALAPLRDATPDDRAADLPTRARLLDLLPVDATSPNALETAWRATPRGTTVPLGVAVDGDPLVVDLATDGPHVLVAGTTGSGKSELLQTLVAGLAVANRPDEMSFVLIDYKGGSAFADCARLPHTVGVVTDLDGHLTERALQSLGAELRRRERILLAAGCTDLDDYLRTAAPGSPPLPRLVLVVDEFASLVDELPDFVGGLVGVAQRGRSLGVHLVLATQRPGGVVSADIRANTGLRIALRMTDAAESRDVVDVRDAADIGRFTPGRAVLRTGAGGVRHVQTARVGGQAYLVVTAPVARRVSWETVGELRATAIADAPAGCTDLARIVVAATEAARRLGAPAAASPWQPPLPSVVTSDDLDGIAGAVAFGLRDLPREQRRATVTLGLDGGDHLVVAGGARSGRSTLLRTVAGTLAERFDVFDAHLYAIDAGGGALSALVALPHCGAVVARDETARGDRLLALLVEDLERRQQQLAQNGLSSHDEQRRTAEPEDRMPWVVLLVDGWEGLQHAYEEVDHGRPLEALARIVREGATAGFRVVITGGRSLLTSRIGGAVHDRLVLRLPDPTDYGLAGISLRQVPADLPAGRALLPDGSEVQVALLPGDPTGAGQVHAIGQIAALACSRPASSLPNSRPGPLRVDALPTRIGFEDVEAEAKAHATDSGWTLLGVGGDRLHPVGVDLPTDGPAFVVAGPPGSGRSTALATMGRWLRQQGRPTVVVSHRRSPLRALLGTPGVLACLGPGDDVALRDLLLAEPALTVLADDAETLHDTPIEQPLLSLLHHDADVGPSLVLAGSVGEMAGCFRGLTVEARRGRTGLLLGQLSPGDGDLLGVRLPRRAAGPTGSGLLVVQGQITPVQIAHTVI